MAKDGRTYDRRLAFHLRGFIFVGMFLSVAMVTFALTGVSWAGLGGAIFADRNGDHGRALQELRPLVGQVDPGALFRIGETYYWAQKHKEAVYWYEQASKIDFAPAQYKLGTMYEFGEGVRVDYEIAASWYGNAAKHGFAPAQYRLGNLYRMGLGVALDLALAEQWSERAAEQGFSVSQRYSMGFQ